MSGAARIITCIVALGQGRRLLEMLRREEDVTSAHLHHARGIGRATRAGRSGVASGTERDVVQAVVDEARAERVFERLYRESGIADAPGALLYEARLDAATHWRLPDLPEEA